ATRSSDELECIFSHEADEIERRRGDRATTATRSSNNHNFLKIINFFIVFHHLSLAFGVEMSSLRLKLAMISNWGVGGAFILLFHTVVNPDPISPLIAEYVPFSSDKRYATTQVKAPPQLQKTGAVRVSTVSHGFVYEPYALHEKILWWRRVNMSAFLSLVLVRDIWVFEKSLFHTGACWRLCGRIEFPSKNIIQHTL
ncbi:hypothetical protein HID58_042129, partial [Brassica napus]